MDINSSKKHKKDLGLYIHIPFCVKKCDYCDFLSAPADTNTKNDYIRAVIAEIISCKEYAAEYLVKTIFIGGGTPSCVDGQYIADILRTIKDVFSVYEQVEITIETNPGTLTKEKLSIYKKAGINRLSIGLQSADNNELERIGRIHTFEEFLSNYNLARNMGFNNINVDLISALPGQNLADWMKTLGKVVQIEPEHISAYSLILEEGTPFMERYSEEDLDEELDRDIYAATKDFLENAGYRRYEISNYAKPGYECKHNTSYWIRTDYLGLGLGSSSLIHNTRFHNERDLRTYIKQSFDYHNIRKELEVLSKKDQMEEFMFLGLRLCKGINTEEFELQFGVSLESIYGNVINQSVREGLLAKNKEQLYLTEKGIDLSNTVMARFLLDDQVKS